MVPFRAKFLTIHTHVDPISPPFNIFMVEVPGTAPGSASAQNQTFIAIAEIQHFYNKE